MTFLSEITTRVMELIGVSDTPSVSTQKDKKPNSVNGYEIKGGNVDKTDFGNAIKSVGSVDNVAQIKGSIKAACRKNNIDEEEVMKYLYELTGKTPAEFNNLDKDIQKALLSYVSDAIAMTEKSDKVNKLEAVKTEARLVWEAVSDGKFANREEIEKFEADVVDTDDVKDIADVSKKISKEEFEAKKANIEKTIQAQYAKDMASLEKLPKNQRAEAKNAIDARYRFIRRKVFTETMISTPSDRGIAMMSIVHSGDLGVAAKEFLGTRVDDKEREFAASKIHDYKCFNECIEAAQARGEDITSEEALKSFEAYNTEFVSWKDIDASISYEFHATSARRSGKLPEDVYKSIAKGIGIGAYANHVMDAVEKEALIKCWINSNSDFLTDEEIASVAQAADDYIQEYQSKHPETKCVEVRKVKELASEVLKRHFNEPSDNKILYSKSNSQSCDKKNIADVKTNKKNETLDKKDIKVENVQREFASGNITITEALRNISFPELCKDSNVRNAKKYEIVEHLRTVFDLDILKTLALQCGMMNEVLDNYRGNKKNELISMIRRNATYEQRVQMSKIENAAS